MAVKWNVRRIKANSSGGVTEVHYCAWDEEVSGSGIATSRISGSYDGIQTFTPDSSNSLYTQFDQLTEDEVLAWCKELIGTEKMTLIETSIANQILQQQTEDTEVSFPWR
jgi:hypothetical protein